MVKNIFETYRTRMRRVKRISFSFSLVPVLSVLMLFFWTGKIPSLAVDICFAGYLGCYIVAIALFVIGRKIYTNLDLITFILILLESLLVVMALFIWVSFEWSDGLSC